MERFVLKSSLKSLIYGRFKFSHEGGSMKGEIFNT